MCFFLLGCFCSLQLSPLPEPTVTVLEHACPSGQIAGKLKEGHEHLGAFAAVLPAKTTSFSPHSGPQTKLEQPAWAHRSFVLGPRVAVLGPNEQRSCAELCTERLRFCSLPQASCFPPGYGI